MNKKINEQIKEEFDFINERVVNIKRARMLKLFGMGIGGAFLVCVLIYSYLWYNDIGLNDVMEKGKDRINTSISGKKFKENYYTTRTTGETASVFSEEEMKKSVLTINYNMRDESSSGDTVIIKPEKTCGIVINIDQDIYILVHGNDLHKNDEVTVNVGDTHVLGKVTASYEDFKLQMVCIRKSDLAGIDMKQIKPAKIATKADYKKPINVLDVGNPENGKITIKKGTLTLTKNIASILDARLIFVSTDIKSSENENGFIFDTSGNVIGISREEINKNVSVINMSGIGQILNYFISGERIPCIGIYGREVTDDVIESIDKKMPRGIYVSSTAADSPAYRQGILNGDIIVAINGKKIKDFDTYTKNILELNPESKVDVTVSRKGHDGYKNIDYNIEVSEVEEK